MKPFNPAKQRVDQVRPPSVRPYSADEGIERAVNVAYVCNRPLLLLGPSGSGKSTLARYVAWCLEFDYLEQVVTSRTAAEDLKWRFDAVRRLHASKDELGGDKDLKFVTPGVLWEAFDPEGAAKLRPEPRQSTEPRRSNRESFGNKGTVVLLDEIDKADPDVPNDLLVTLDMQWFHCTDVDRTVEARRDRKILVMITSNEERELPRAFLRRCIVMTLSRHAAKKRREIAEMHHPGVSSFLLDRVDKVFERIEAAAKLASVPQPSTAEYLDAVAACLGLDLHQEAIASEATEARTAGLEDPLDKAVATTLWKSPREIPAVEPKLEKDEPKPTASQGA